MLLSAFDKVQYQIDTPLFEPKKYYITCVNCKEVKHWIIVQSLVNFYATHIGTHNFALREESDYNIFCVDELPAAIANLRFRRSRYRQQVVGQPAPEHARVLFTILWASYRAQIMLLREILTSLSLADLFAPSAQWFIFCKCAARIHVS